jgi:hypothetical protein
MWSGVSGKIGLEVCWTRFDRVRDTAVVTLVGMGLGVRPLTGATGRSSESRTMERR